MGGDGRWRSIRSAPDHRSGLDRCGHGQVLSRGVDRDPHDADPRQSHAQHSPPLSGSCRPAQTGTGRGPASPDEDHRPRGTSRRRNRQGPALCELVNADAVTCVHAEEPESDDLVYTWIGPPRARWRSSPVRKTRSRDEPCAGFVRSETPTLRPSSPSSSPIAYAPGRSSPHSLTATVSPSSLGCSSSPGVVVTDLNVPIRSRRSKLPRVPTRKIEQVVLVSDMTRPIRRRSPTPSALGHQSLRFTSTSTRLSEIVWKDNGRRRVTSSRSSSFPVRTAASSARLSDISVIGDGLPVPEP